MENPKGIDWEKGRLWLQMLELWFTKATRIAIVMCRGAYWLGERRRLLNQLGAQTYDLLRRKELQAESLEPLVEQLDRLNKRLKSEEAQVEAIRFGSETQASKGDSHAE